MSDEAEAGVFALHYPPSRDEAIADPGAKGHDREALEVATAAKPSFVLGERDEVVRDHDGETDRCLEPGAQVDVGPVEERSPEHGAVNGHESTDAEADGRDVGTACAQVVDEAGQGIDHDRGFTRVEGHLRLCDHLGAQVRHDAERAVSRAGSDADEVARFGDDVEQAGGSSRVTARLFADLDQQSGLDERLRESRERACRQIESVRAICAREMGPLMRTSSATSSEVP